MFWYESFELKCILFHISSFFIYIFQVIIPIEDIDEVLSLSLLCVCVRFYIKLLIEILHDGLFG